MFSVFRLLPVLVLPVILNGCQTVAEQSLPSSPAEVISSETQQLANRKAEAIFAEYSEWQLETSPVLASFSGIRGQFDWDNISAEAQEQRLETIQVFRNRLKAINETALNITNQGSYHTLIDELEYQLLLAPLQSLNDPFANTNNWLLRIEATLLQHHPITNIEDAHDYISRIHALPALLKRWQETLTNREQSGYFSPAFAYQQNISRLNAWLGTKANKGANKTTSKHVDENNLFWQDFRNKLTGLTLYPSTRQLLLKKMKRAITRSATPAFRQLLASLKQQQTQAPGLVSLQQPPQGMRYYQLQLQHHSQTDMDANQMFQYALSELDKIQQEILALAQRNGWQSSQQQPAFKELKSWLSQQHQPLAKQANDPSIQQQLSDAQKTILNQQAEQLPYEFTVIPQTPLAVIEGENPPGQYTSDDQNFAYIPATTGNAAQFRWNPGALEAFSRAQLTLDIARYAVPGLHMQLALASENQQLPAFRRQPYMSHFNTGWQLYSQELALVKNTDNALQLRFWHNQMTPLVLMVIDSGIHAKGWQRLQALEFVQNNLLNELPEAQAMVDQVTLAPAKSSGVYLGFKALQQLRKRIQARFNQSTAFDEASYHSHLLQLGALPLDALEQQMMHWADERIQQALLQRAPNSQ